MSTTSLLLEEESEESSFNGPGDSPDELDIENNINIEIKTSKSQTSATVRPENILELANENGQNAHEECKKIDHKSRSSQSETSQESSQNCQVYLYRGYSLNISSVVKKAGPDVLSLFEEKRRSVNEEKTRTFVKCLVCAEFEEEAKRFATNGQVYLAHGVRCDGKRNYKIS